MLAGRPHRCGCESPSPRTLAKSWPTLGDRTEATARQRWNRLPTRYREAQVYTDSWEPYAAVMPVNQHRRCRKSAGRTVHVERWNNTLR